MSRQPSRGAARLAAILDALPDGLLLVNCNGTVVNANTIALEMFESPGTGLVGRGLLDLLPEFDSRLIPGSMRRPENADERGRTKPTRMIARRTDRSEYPVEVTSANLADGRDAYASQGGGHFTGDELLMLVVRDLSGTVDTEAELARSQRQTEMILRAAAEGVVGTDTDGRVVLVNPAAAQILGYRASDLGGQELHPLVLHSRGDGEPFSYDESPLADTLRSGRKHRVRGQVLWSKSGKPVPVDLTTAPVRDGDQLVGAVMTFTDRRPYEELVARQKTEAAERDERHAAELAERDERHAAELADRSERYSAEIEERDERLARLTAQHTQLTAVLGDALRGPMVELYGELRKLADDPAGQLWPEANQMLHHLAAGYARMSTLVDSVLGYQRLDSGHEALAKEKVLVDAVVAAGIDAAVELIGPGRVQFAVHTPPIEAEIDSVRFATALAHLIADVAGVDSTGRARLVPGGGYVDSTVVVASAQRGDVVRIEVRGPFAGGDPVHEPIVRGIVRAHGGVLQTHEVPGMSGSAYVVELPLGAGAGAVTADPVGMEAGPGAGTDSGAGAAGPDDTLGGASSGPGVASLPAQQDGTSGGGRRRARRAASPNSTDSFLDPVGAAEAVRDTERPPTGRRRGRPSPAEQGPEREALALPAPSRPAEGSVVTAAEHGSGRPALGETVPPQGVPADSPVPAAGTAALPGGALPAQATGTGRRARRALASAPTEAAQGTGDGGARSAFALPPADADRAPSDAVQGRHDAVRTDPTADHTPPLPHPLPTGRRRAQAAPAPNAPDAPNAGQSPQGGQGPDGAQGVQSSAERAATARASAQAQSALANITNSNAGPAGAADAQPAPGATLAPPAPTEAPEPVRSGDTGSVPLPPAAAQAPLPTAPPVDPATATAGRQPLPPAEPMPADSTQGRAFSVRTLGQGVPFAQHLAPQQNQPPGAAAPGGRRRKLSTPQESERPEPGAPAVPPNSAQPVPPQPAPPAAATQQHSGLLSPPAGRLPEGRAYSIDAPDENAAEGPEPLDGPGGAVEVANQPQPRPVDDELPPEPLDNPRRLLVWPAPDVSTQQALSDRGYRPVIVNSREEVDAQIAAFPAALFVDPLTGPITKTALQSLRQAAVAADVPVLVTAGLGQATREAAYGADPAVLLKALAPRDSEQHPARVLLIEEHEEIAFALTATLERRGMQVERAASDSEAVTIAAQLRPNLVVMDLLQVRRRRAGIIDWLRANGQLNHTPLVVYTSAGINQAELPKLTSGETVLFLAERSTSSEVQSRIVDLLAKIGTN
ncbi:PAS domain-containing protein [Streptomyces sp. NPDC050504]|uniref:hybrid sensor histidine kinase/response regulator n=1 Tax=Streptomyces sp. NPDC050504 TaxID=3365618 RepID=UPI0037B0725D